ncbi:MAG: hypothetical protein MZW92_76725 [Comamonadaceae bacterium]|nr:hypothetical protein [Comamonadaceae bacterium]
MPDEAALAMSLIENIQREDLNPLEEASRPAAADRRIRHDPPAGRATPSAAPAPPPPTCCACCNLAPPVQDMLMSGEHRHGPRPRACCRWPRASRRRSPTRIAAKRLFGAGSGAPRRSAP